MRRILNDNHCYLPALWISSGITFLNDTPQLVEYQEMDWFKEKSNFLKDHYLKKQGDFLYYIFWYPYFPSNVDGPTDFWDSRDKKMTFVYFCLLLQCHCTQIFMAQINKQQKLGYILNTKIPVERYIFGWKSCPKYKNLKK